VSRIAYLDCFSGVSGDMLLGALIGAGVPEDALRAELAKLDLPGWRLEVGRVTRAGVAAVKVDVVVTEPRPPHRRLGDVLAILAGSHLPDPDRERGASVFRALAAAEARIHGVTPEEVGFHEVGAIDAVVDVMGAIAGLRLLGVEELYASALPVGTGTIRAAHGALPAPAPATLELLAAARAPLAPSDADVPFELVTPTGAAIVVTLATFGRPAMRLESVGYGAGARDIEGRPNVLRLWAGERIADRRGVMTQIETNIDDLNPEIYAYAQEKLFEAGAADVWFTPIQMKKNRPAVLLSVLCPPEREDACVRVLLRETSTLGVRVSEVRRHEAARETLAFESSLGPAEVKVKRLDGEPPRVAPEYESCRRLAEKSGLPLTEVYRIVQREAEGRL
jgi:uncharacterized protein (TIGR00299 family) protein